MSFLHSCLVWDNHACMPLRPDDDSFLPQLARYKQAGVDLVSLNVTFDVLATDSLLGFRMLGRFRRWLHQHDDAYMLVHTVADIERARNENKLGVCFDIEGGVAIEPGIELIQAYYDLGVRWMLIAYNEPNKLGGGCQSQRDDGLSDFGRLVIEEMERVGMVLCCTHTAERTALQAIEFSRNPVILSHSNPSAVREHQRNVSDGLLRAIGASGGVVNVNGIGLFLSDENDISTRVFLRHVNYVANLIGPKHVGIGLDYVFDRQELDDFLLNNPEIFPPEKGYGKGMAMIGPEQISEIAEAMLADGWSETDLRGFLGENNLRVAKQVWK